jgi:hypothetical protein
MYRFSTYLPHNYWRKEFTEEAHKAAKDTLSRWRGKKQKYEYHELCMCPPCMAGIDYEGCPKELFKHIMKIVPV